MTKPEFPGNKEDVTDADNKNSNFLSTQKLVWDDPLNIWLITCE
jgi:hypothetical protein